MAKGKFKRALARARKTLPRKRMRMTRKSRKPRRNVRNNTQVKLGLGFPKQMVITHKYAETVSITSTGGVQGNYIFSANGLFKPNVTAAGHQPMYFDQMAALYNHYTVIGAKATFRITPQAANEDAFRICLTMEDDTTITPAGVDSNIEQSKSSWRLVSPNANNTIVLRSTYSAKKVYGGSVMAQEEQKGTPTANPAEESYFALTMQASGVATATAEFIAFIEYITIWSELKNIAGS